MNRVQERDDIGSLPIPAAAKKYARRSGLKSMEKQPKEFQKVNAMITNPGKKDKFQNYTAGETTSGTNLDKGQPNALKGVNECAQEVIEHIFNENRFRFTSVASNDREPSVYRVYPAEGEKPVIPGATVYNVQLPNGYVNSIEVPDGVDALSRVIDRLGHLVTSGRGFINGDTIITPWVYLSVKDAENGQLTYTINPN